MFFIDLFLYYGIVNGKKKFFSYGNGFIRIYSVKCDFDVLYCL